MKPVMCFNPWDATNGILALMVGEVMAPEQLVQANYQYMDTYIHMIMGASHLINEVMFPSSRLSTRPDSTQVAKLVVSLEERVYAIEDALMTFEDGDLKVTPDQVEEELAGRLECVEGKQGTLDTLSSILQRTEVIGDLAGRLERVEGKLDLLLAALEKIEAKAHVGTVSSGDGE
jgi:hypothetical protein